MELRDEIAAVLHENVSGPAGPFVDVEALADAVHERIVELINDYMSRVA